MKKYLIGALLCALVTIVPLAAQTSVSCDGCTHVVSYYMGEGGLIATAAEDAEMVNWLASCGGVTRTGMLTPNDDGVVSTLFSGDLACAMDGGKFEIGPVMDGGWYWITDAENSAVGGLVDMDVLMNDHTAEPTGAGDGVTMTKGSGATFLKETATGRVGILPTILPVMDMEPEMATPCGVAGGPGTSAANAWTRRVSGCMMGDGGTTVLANYSNAITGGTTRVMNGGTVTRPGGSGTLTIVIDLWGNGSGHFLTAADSTTVANGGDFLRGHAAAAATDAGRTAHRYQGVTFRGTVGSGPAGAALPTTGTVLDAAAGMVLDTSVTNVASLSIGAKSSYCSKTNNHTATVNVYADVDATGQTQVTPSIKVAGARANPTNPTNAGSISFNVVCPAASANMGQELVPENPFPTER